MKRVLILLLAAALCGALLSSCGYDPQEMIAKGDMAMAERDFENALTYYRMAGSEGSEKLRMLFKTQAKAKNWNHDKYDVMLEYLLEEANEIITEDEAYIILAEYMTEGLEELETSLEEKEALEENETRFYNSSIREIEDHATDVIREGTPGLKEAISKANNLRAEVSLKAYGPDYNKVTWKYVLEDWNLCTDGKGYEVQQASELIRKGEFAAGLERLNEILGSEKLAVGLYQEISSKMQYKSVGDILESNGAYRKLYPESKEQTLTKVFEDLPNLCVGTDSLEGSVALNKTMIEELKTKCGLVPDGKILILHKPDIDKDGLDVAVELMQHLPDRYYPYDLKSIEYVIVLNGEDVLTGQEYDSGTKQVREDVTLVLYDPIYKTEILSMTEKGPVSMFITYYGDPPEYYSAGAPDISEIMLEACKIIEMR